MNPQIYRTIISEFDRNLDDIDDDLSHNDMHPDDAKDAKLRRQTLETAFEWAQKMLALHVDYIGIRQDSERDARQMAHDLGYPVGIAVLHQPPNANEEYGLHVFELITTQGIDHLFPGNVEIGCVFPDLTHVYGEGRYMEV